MRKPDLDALWPRHLACALRRGEGLKIAGKMPALQNLHSLLAREDWILSIRIYAEIKA